MVLPRRIFATDVKKGGGLSGEAAAALSEAAPDIFIRWVHPPRWMTGDKKAPPHPGPVKGSRG